MTTPNNQPTPPTPPEGYRLLTPEEYDKPLPDGAKFLGLESWVSSVCEGMIPKMRNGLASDIYAIPITVPATGDTTADPSCDPYFCWGSKCPVHGDTTNDKEVKPCAQTENQLNETSAHSLTKLEQTCASNAALDVQPVEQRQELLPCPFCGESTHLSVERNDEYEEEDFNDDRLFYRVICDASGGGCGSCSGFRKTTKATIELWNTRQ